MTKPELIRLMRLLSGLESILLFSGMQHLNQRAHHVCADCIKELDKK